MKSYLSRDENFLTTLQSMMEHGEYVDLISETVEDNAGISPVGLRWYYPFKKQPGARYNFPVEDLARPVDAKFECSRCDESNNPCFYQGICLSDGFCACINGGSGALCQDPPLGDGICNPYFNNELFGWDGGDCCGGTCRGPECGRAGFTVPFGIDTDQQAVNQSSILGYESCKDPSMAPLTIELQDFDIFNLTEWYAVIGNEDGDPFCATAAINVRCSGVTYLHFPPYTFHNESDCSQSFVETIYVPYGSECALTTSIACFGPHCLDHNVSVHYGEGTTSVPIQSGNTQHHTKLSFGVPSKCLTDLLQNYGSSIFDLSTNQGTAANILSNDQISESLCNDNELGAVLERYALTVLNSTAHFKSSNWNQFQCHGWGIPAVRIECTNSSVTSLVLDENVMFQAGTIPTEIGLLTSLEELVLRTNNFTSTIPTELGLLTMIERLELWENELTGVIPAELSSLKRLTALAISTNKLTGTIPSVLAKLPLTGLFLDDNFLSGPVPSELGLIQTLATLSLPLNQLSGQIPSELGTLSSVTILSLAGNSLSGPIPSVLLSLPSIAFLDLSLNSLSSTIPTEMNGMQNLIILGFAGNNLTGRIPSEFGFLTNLGFLELSHNSLTGTLPAELAETALTGLGVSGNRLSGSIPTGISRLRLTALAANDNMMTGEIPSEIASMPLIALILANNSFVGEIPSELLTLQDSLELCALENNNFTGGTAPEICTV